MFDRPPLAGAPRAGLHFIRNEQDSVTVANGAQLAQEVVGRHHVTALALNRLDKDCRNLLRRHGRLEELLLDESCAAQAELLRGLRASRTAAIGVWIRHV